MLCGDRLKLFERAAAEAESMAAEWPDPGRYRPEFGICVSDRGFLRRAHLNVYGRDDPEFEGRELAVFLTELGEAASTWRSGMAGKPGNGALYGVLSVSDPDGFRELETELWTDYDSLEGCRTPGEIIRRTAQRNAEQYAECSPDEPEVILRNTADMLACGMVAERCVNAVLEKMDPQEIQSLKDSAVRDFCAEALVRQTEESVRDAVDSMTYGSDLQPEDVVFLSPFTEDDYFRCGGRFNYLYQDFESLPELEAMALYREDAAQLLPRLPEQVRLYETAGDLLSGCGKPPCSLLSQTEKTAETENTELTAVRHSCGRH